MSRSLVALAALLCPTLALAQADQPEPDVVIPAETVLDEGDFHDLRIEGTMIGPGIDIYIAPTRKPFPSWVELRRDFRAEMSASVDEID